MLIYGVSSRLYTVCAFNYGINGHSGNDIVAGNSYYRVTSRLNTQCRGRSHKVGPAAKVGPCPFGVVNNGTGNISLLVLTNIPEGTDERYQNNSNAISKM